MMTAGEIQLMRKVIGRELDAIERGEYQTLEEIPAAVREIALALARGYSRILAINYLRERVPTARLDDTMLKLEAIGG